VIWSKPDDLPFGEKLPPLGEEKADRVMVLLLDGSVQTLSANIKPDLLRLLIDTQDGIPIPGDVFDGGRGGFSRPGAGGTSPDPVPPKEAKEEEARLLEQLVRSNEALTQEKLKVDLLTIVTLQLENAVKTGAAKKEELDKSLAELEVARERLRQRERRCAGWRRGWPSCSAGRARRAAVRPGRSDGVSPAPAGFCRGCGLCRVATASSRARRCWPGGRGARQ
jgi:hypothetical protein